MSYSAKILLDSISETNKRITTFEITFPRCVLAEAKTHRVIRGWNGNVEELLIANLGINDDENLSRNSASSRAIPINKMLQRVKENPFIPEKFGRPISGMGAKEYWGIETSEHRFLEDKWRKALGDMIYHVEDCLEIANKEDLNRLLEPFMWHTAIITATEFDNFFKLRTADGADWKIRKIADLMYEAYHNNECYNNRFNQCDKAHTYTQKLKVGEWHCPLVSEEDDFSIETYIINQNIYGDFNKRKLEIQKKISVARCARVSYLTHDGKRDIEKDLGLFEKLRSSGHWSPFEHVATPTFVELDYEMDANFEHEIYTIWPDQKRIFHELHNSNFIGWKQFRKEFADENCTNFRKEN